MLKEKFANRLLTSFSKETSGNIAVMFAIALLPILQAVGCAVDYSHAASSYTKLTACADSAVLMAVDPTGMSDNASKAEKRVKAAFTALCSETGGATVNDVTVTATDTGGARTAVLNFTATRPNTFMRVVGMPSTDIKGSATAKSAKPTFIDVYSLLDVSPSMGLAATTDDQARMKALTGGCEFACHSSGPDMSFNTYPIAVANSVKLRIDVLRDSWINMIKQASKVDAQNQFRFATYTFDSGLNMLQSLTGSYPSAMTTANLVTLKVVPSTGPGSTYADNAISALVPQVPVAGDGSSAANSKKYVIFVTDGVQDFVNSSAMYGHETKTVDASKCTALKSKGIQVAVIYTTYLALPEDTYINLVKPFADNIAPTLSSCASPNLYFQATDAKDIENAFSQIFSRILSTARLSS